MYRLVVSNHPFIFVFTDSFADIQWFKNQFLVPVNVIALWIKIPTPLRLSGYGSMELKECNFIHMVRMFVMALYFLRNGDWKLTLFLTIKRQFSSFVYPRLMMPTATRKKVGIHSNGMEGKSTKRYRQLVLNMVMRTVRLLCTQKIISNNRLLCTQ